MSAPAPLVLDEQQKSDQIALHVYTKLFHVVYQARSGETANSSSGVGVGVGGGVGGGVERGGGGGAGVHEGAERPTKANKTDRWFNLETPDSDLFPRELREVYKALSATFPRAPPQLYIHVLLAVPDAASATTAANAAATAITNNNTTTTTTITAASASASAAAASASASAATATNNNSNHNNVLVVLAQSNSRSGGGARIRIEPTPRYVLLEKWAMTFVPNDVVVGSPHSHLHSPATGTTATAATATGTTAGSGGDAVALATIYKHGIPLFRSLYTLLRILPVWKLYKRLRRRTTGPSSSQLSIQLHVTDKDEVVGGMGRGPAGSGGILLFGVPPSPTHSPLPTLTHTFPSIPHPLGSFTLSATYLESPTFQLDDLESLLSSKFISLDEGFVPTLTSKPRSEASSLSPESIAERFVIPLAPSSAAGAAAGMRQQLHPPPPPGGSGALSGSAHSPSLPALSRLRLESSPGRHGRSTSLSLPPSPVAAPVPLPALAPSQAHASGSGSGLGLGLGLGLGPTTPPPSSALGMRRSSSSSSSTPPPPLPLQLHTHPYPHQGTAMPIPFAQQHPHSTTHSPYSQSSSLGSQMGSQALPIRRPNTINPFKANTVLGANASGGSGSASGSGSGSGSASGLVAPGTSAGSIHSLRHASSPLGPGGGGGGDSSSLTRSPPYATSPLMVHSQQPFPTQHSPHPPFSPVPQHQQGLSGSGSGSSVSALGLGLGLVGSAGSSSSGMQGYIPPSSPVPAHQSSSSAPTIPTRKRYSSSFSHRYMSPGSVGSAPGTTTTTGAGAGAGVGVASPAGSTSPLGVSAVGVAREWGRTSSPGPEDVIGKSRSRSSSFLGKRTEDDDISLFMQDIETRKPLSGRWRMEVHEREESGGEREDMGGQEEGRGRHMRGAIGGTDGTNSGPARAGGESIASEVTMKGSGRTLAPIITTKADASNVPDTNNEASSRRTSYAYHPPHQSSPLSPRPRPKLQGQSVSPVSPDAGLGHAKHQSQESPSLPSLPVATASSTNISTGTGTSAPDAAPSISPPGAIPTSQAEVEVRLKKMNETFLKSLAGFGDGWATSASMQGVRGFERRSASESGVSRTSVETGLRSPGTERFESRGRDPDRVLPPGLANLSRHGSEEVIGTLELGGAGGGGREYSLERAQLAAMGMGRGRKHRA